MEFKISLYALIYALAGITTLVPIWISWRMRRYPGIYSLFRMMFFVSVWAFLCAAEMAALGKELKYAIVAFENVASLTFTSMMCVFVLDYFSIGRQFIPLIRRSIWIIAAIILLMSFTNPWHHLLWQDYFLAPSGINLLLLKPGPVYHGLAILDSSMYLILLIVLGNFILHNPRPVRIHARTIFLGIFAAWFSQISYELIADQTIGIVIPPIGAVVWCTLISWVVFEDLLGQFQRQSDDLRVSRDALAAHLTELRLKIGGMYDLVYLNTSGNDQKNLVKNALEKMRETIGCDAVIYCFLANGQCILEAEAGLDESQKQQLTAWTAPEANLVTDVSVWPVAMDGAGFPGELPGAGFQSASARSISLITGRQVSIYYLWKSRHSFPVDEIALMGAQADVLGMILENDHTRRLSQEWAMMEERQQLGRELHDRISQDLFSLSIFGANSVHHAATGMRAALDDDLQTINTLVRRLLNEMRLLLFELQPHSRTEALPLEKAIQERFAIVESHVNIETNLIVSGCDTLPPLIAKVLYSVVVEALNNVVKHARAKRVWIRVQANDREVRLEVRDDGVGFDLRQNQRQGLGLENMRQRVEQVNGRFKIIAKVGSGSRIEALLPLGSAVTEQAVEAGRI